MIVIVPVRNLAVVTIIYIFSITGIAKPIIVIETRLRKILVALALVAVKELLLTAPLLDDILDARFATTHAYIPLESHSYYELR
jgi:hypothetical protein